MKSVLGIPNAASIRFAIVAANRVHEKARDVKVAASCERIPRSTLTRRYLMVKKHKRPRKSCKR